MTSRTRHPDLPKNLALIGGRGCGKSSIAKRLARSNRYFMLFSVDALIRYESDARTIPSIIAAEGWRSFRDHEYAILERVSAFEGGALIDCGGGIVVDVDDAGREIYSERKVDALRRNTLVVYLSRDVEYLAARIGTDPNRPKLSETESFRSIMERREPWYRAASHHVLECGGRSKDDLTRSVLEWFYERIGVEAGEAERALS